MTENPTILGLPLEFWTPGPWGVPFPIWSVAMTLTGLMVGSFLNVVIWRLPRGESVVTPSSHCPSCGAPIPLRLNIPALSWLWLRGRAACCGAPIAPRYVLVEAVTGGLFLATWLRWGHESPGAAAALAFFWASLLASSVIDLEHYIVPDELSLGGAAAGVLLSAAFPSLHGAANAAAGMRGAGAGALAGAGLVYGVVRLGKLLFGRERVPLPPGERVVFMEESLRLPEGEVGYGDLFYRSSDAVTARATRVELATRCRKDVTVRLELLRKPPTLRLGDEVLNPEEEPWMSVEASEVVLPREAMGLGDVKLMAAIGAFLGWRGACFSLFASAVMGSVLGALLIALRRKSLARLPYGPFLSAAAFVWAFGGREWVLAWWEAQQGGLR